MYEVTAEVLEETKLIFSVVGALTVAWAEVEVMLDYTNGVLIFHRNMTEDQLPRSLKPKVGFFKKSFERIPELASLRDTAAEIVDELTRCGIPHRGHHGRQQVVSHRRTSDENPP